MKNQIQKIICNKFFKRNLKILLVVMVMTPPLFAITAVSAETGQYDYTVLAPLPCIGSDESCSTQASETSLKTYLPGVFRLMVGIAAVFAVMMIIFGGFQYISSDAIQNKTQGKERIKNSIYGLVLVIGAWLILNTINPNLLQFNLNIDTVQVAPVTGGGTLGGELSAGTGKILPGYSLTQAQIDLNASMVKDLKDNYDINVNNNGRACSNGEVSGCTNLVGMTAVTFKGVTDLKKVCPSCNITITGGTEGGHASHGPNLPPIDLGLDSNLDQYILSNQVAAPQTTSIGVIYTSKVGNRNATFLRESDHWHVVFE